MSYRNEPLVRTSPNHLSLELVVEDAVGAIWLNRPDRHNAFDETLIAELRESLDSMAANPAVRVVLLGGRGRSFCAGADLEWMQRQAHARYTENVEDARKLAGLMRTLAQLPKPTVARVHGAALGGGLGLVAACDIAVASRDATFGTTEARLGLTPSTISPYVIAAIGERACRRYFQTAERFDADEALRLGLIHVVTEPAALDPRVAALLTALREAGPQAQSTSKRLIASLRGRNPVNDQVLEETAVSIATVRSGSEAQEGIAAFFAKRKPRWTG
jgi:methylglutaconyl-CoA hydratase